MADLANPVVAVSYACGCSFTDDTETGGTPRFRFGGDETRIFNVARDLTGKNATQKRQILQTALDSISDTVGKPSRASLEAKATSAEVYDTLLARTATDVAQTVDEKGVRFPQPPATCPRHNSPAVTSSASYLNPADTPKGDVEAAIETKP